MFFGAFDLHDNAVLHDDGNDAEFQTTQGVADVRQGGLHRRVTFVASVVI